MGEFGSAADLNGYLIGISPRYGKYATSLWDNEIRSTTELAYVSVTTLTNCGVSNVAHAQNIQAHVKSGEMGSAKYSRHRNQIEPILHAWLTELEQAKVDLMQSRTITDQTSLLLQHDINLKDLSEEVSQVIKLTEWVLRKGEWLDMYHDIMRAKADVDRRIDVAMLVNRKKAL